MYKVDIFKGYNNKKLIGLSPEQVIENVPNYEDTILGLDGARRDFFQDIIAYYDENKICSSIQFINEETKVFIDDIQFMGIKEKEIINKLKLKFPSDDLFINEEFYIYPEKALSFFVTEGCIGGITVGRKGFFDYVINKTGPASFKKL